jgi:integrase
VKTPAGPPELTVDRLPPSVLLAQGGVDNCDDVFGGVQCCRQCGYHRWLLRTVGGDGIAGLAAVDVAADPDLDWVTSHSCRKAVATRLDEAGLSAREIADHLGHAKPSMTQDVYMGRGVASAQAATALTREAA